MGERKMTVRSGDWVEVKAPLEILNTLEAGGNVEGLPFMPEMAEFCGQRFRVLRRAEKTCIEYPGRRYKMQEFRNNDVVVLDMPRCSGASHGGCQRTCVLFWKTAWLRKVESGESQTPVSQTGQEELQSALQAMSAPDRYLCQSTELNKATRPLPRTRVMLKCFYDVFSGSRSVLEMAKLVFYPLWSYATWWYPRPIRVGKLKRTPVVDLNLRPGEWVTIKSEDEIVETLDSRALNRGLSCDGGMRQFCGGKYQVKGRLERMISETTGEMFQVKSTVMLEGLNCLCWYNHVGGCPRDDYMYWREAWLKPADGRSSVSSTAANGGIEQTASRENYALLQIDSSTRRDQQEVRGGRS